MTTVSESENKSARVARLNPALFHSLNSLFRPHPAVRLGAKTFGGILVWFGLTLGLFAAEPDVRRDAAVEAVQRVMPSVVNIATEEVIPISDPLENLFRDFFGPYYRRRPPNTQYSLGSGVILDEEGYVLTNFHVVGRARRVWVKLSDGREFEADKEAVNSATDVALIKIRAKKHETFTAIRLAADDDLLLGETVLALGNPFGLGGSVSKGILSSKTRRPPTQDEPLDVLDWLQTDAAINPGNSGGPLINLKGELIGINVAVLNQGQGIGFAIPVKRVTEKLAEIYSPEGMDGIWFGARVRPGSLPLQIAAVQLESPAGKAGLRPGDLILQLNGRAPRSFIDFTGTLRAAKDQRDLVFALQRGAERRNATVRQVPERTFFNADLIRRKIGATVQALTPEAARNLGLSRAEGLMVSAVEVAGPAANVELQRGMIITSLDGQPMNDVVLAAKKLHARVKGEKIRLELIVPSQRGGFIQLSQAAADVVVR
jgi:S1-C subfamily serine protease